MTWFCSLPLLSSLFTACAPPPPFATGYVEGEYVLIAPAMTAQVMSVPLGRGDRVEAGDLLASLETGDAVIALAQAEAQLAQAQSQLADLREGKRPEEINVIEAELASARAQLDEAERGEQRIASLFARGAATQVQSDDAATAATTARAHVAQIEADLVVARLPAREQAIAAAEAAVGVAEAARQQAQWTLDQRSLFAPADGRIDDVLRRPGEIAGPAAPVLSMLPDGAVKLRLYVPEPEIARVAEGTVLSVRCDSCPEGLTARVTYISDAPEFTPPVIYSLENRQKLVFEIEAEPLDGTFLMPGQIVDVSLPDDPA